MWVVKTEDARSILYLLDMELDGKKLRKIGITSKRIEELYANAINAMREYGGHENQGDMNE